MIQQKKEDLFDIPQVSFQPLPPSKKGRKVGLSIIFLFCVGSGLSGWYYLYCYQTPVVVEDLEDSSLLDSEENEVAVKFQVTKTQGNDYSEQGNMHGTTQSDIDGIKKELERMTQKPIQLVKGGGYQQITAPQGIYHIVVGSFLNRAMAKQLVNQLIKEQRGVMLITPPRTERYYHVTIAQTATRDEAEERLKNLKPIYGENIWIHNY